jgi:DNA-binding IclR family transcriptional regulator
MLESEEPRSESQLQRGFRTLELLAEEPRTAADMARALGVNRSTGLRILQELQAMGYVRRDEKTRCFMTVPERLYALAANHPADWDWSQFIHPLLAALRDEMNEATVFGVPANESMVYMAFFPSLHPVAVRERTGSVRPMHASALGKAYLSTLSGDHLDAQLARLAYEGGTERAARGPIELRKRLEEVHALGYAIDRGESIEGVTCVAAPARIGGKVVGAAGFSGPAQRFGDEAIARYGGRLLEELRRVDIPYAP